MGSEFCNEFVMFSAFCAPCVPRVCPVCAPLCPVFSCSGKAIGEYNASLVERERELHARIMWQDDPTDFSAEGAPLAFETFLCGEAARTSARTSVRTSVRVLYGSTSARTSVRMSVRTVSKRLRRGEAISGSSSSPLSVLSRTGNSDKEPYKKDSLDFRTSV